MTTSVEDAKNILVCFFLLSPIERKSLQKVKSYVKNLYCCKKAIRETKGGGGGMIVRKEEILLG
jgi:hypothetical protein